MSPRVIQSCLALLCSGAIVASALNSQSKKDLRDVVVLKTGKSVKGRVLHRFRPDELTLMQGGKRVRIEHQRIRSITTINDHLREFFKRRDKIGADDKATWDLALWAESKGLHAMARLVALELVLRDDKNRVAHEFLGHKKGRRGWRWLRGSTYRSRKAHEKYISDMGHPLTTVGEHFEVQTNAGLRRALDTSMDLERLYLFWMDEFGKDLRLQEVLRPMIVKVWATSDKFPAYTGRKEAFALTRKSGDYAATFYPEKARRPWRLFTVVCQAMVENTLTLQQNDAGWALSRLCAWAEIGIGQWVESCMHGDPGRVVPGEPILDRVRLGRVLKTRPKLKITTHRRYKLFLNPGDRALEYWDTTGALVHFLLDRNLQPSKRDGFLRYVYAAFFHGKGDSSSVFDEALGERLEKTEKRFYAWLRRNAK